MLLNRLFSILIYCFTDGYLKLKEFSCSGESYKNMGNMVVNVYNSKIASKKLVLGSLAFLFFKLPMGLVIISHSVHYRCYVFNFAFHLSF